MFSRALIFKIALTLLIVPALLWLARAGIADFLLLEPVAYIESVRTGKTRPVAIDLSSARERLMLARSWDASNPLVPEYLGQLAIIRAQLVTLSPRLQSEFFRAAVDEFNAGIALRPNSAYLWADRMTAGSAWLEACSRAGLDTGVPGRELSEIAQALRRASFLGPWESKVLEQIVRVGKLRYDEFSPEDRVLIDSAQVRAQKIGVKI